MTPERFRSIRNASGMTCRQLAAFLRIGDERTVRRWSTGEVPVSGPASVIMELMEAGIDYRDLLKEI